MDTPLKPDEEGEFTDSSSNSSILSEEWQDLSKSDFAKVIFCDIHYDAERNTVGCKFQITDNVHEDPCDYIGLFKIGKSECFVSKLLSETECEEDGKLLRCNFSDAGLPDGYYHFQYVTRDGEVCGASTPVEVKRPKEGGKEVAEMTPEEEEEFLRQAEPEEDAVNAENDFVVVEHILEKKNRMLQAEFREKQLALEDKSKLCEEKEEEINALRQKIADLNQECTMKEVDFIDLKLDNNAKKREIESLSTQLKNSDQAVLSCREDLDSMAKLLEKSEEEKLVLLMEVKLLSDAIKDKDNLPAEPDQRILLEQLEDQKFMIRALEDSKQLALKEMSDLSESLSKRTKVLNQTRSELASCKLKLKESDSVVEKQKIHIEKLIKKVDEQHNLEMIRQQAIRDTKLPPKNKDDFDLSKPVQELYANAFQQAEKFLGLVDTLVAKTDFYEHSQEKSFHRLKIMFFVLLGKMKKPMDVINSVDCTPVGSPTRKEKKKPVSRMLPSHQGNNSADCIDMHMDVVPVQKEANAMQKNEPKGPTTSSGLISTNSMQFLSHENHNMKFIRINEILSAGITGLKKEDCAFFKELWDGYNSRPKCIFERPGVVGYDINDPITVLMTPSTREEMKRLEPVFNVVEQDLLTSGKPSPLNEFFMDVLRESIKLEVLLRYMEKTYVRANSEENEKLRKKCDDSDAKRMDIFVDMVQCKDKVDALSSKLTEAEAFNSKLKAEIARKDEMLMWFKKQNCGHMEREVGLLALVKAHEARIEEAAELYKTMYLEMEKLKKKLKRAKGSKESSTVGDVSPFKPREMFDVQCKRLRKTTPKCASPKLAEKAADKQPQMLKVISLKSFSQNAESAHSKHCKKALPTKPYKKCPAADAKASAKLEALIQEKFPAAAKCKVPVAAKCICPTLFDNIPDFLLPKTKEQWDLRSDFMHCSVKHPRKTTPKKCAKAAARCVSDSDTGEHVVRNNTVLSSEGDKSLDKEPIAESKPLEPICAEKPNYVLIPAATDSAKESSSLDERSFSPALNASLEPGNRDLRSVHKLLQEKITKVVSRATPNENKTYFIPCVLCEKSLKVTQDLTNLMNHLEMEHQISMCPVCGLLFEAAFPKKYFLFHVEEHFKSE